MNIGLLKAFFGPIEGLFGGVGGVAGEADLHRAELELRMALEDMKRDTLRKLV